MASDPVFPRLARLVRPWRPTAAGKRTGSQDQRFGCRLSYGPGRQRRVFWAKYARRILAIVSTTSIPNLAPASPTEATVDPPSRGSRLDADHPENGVLIPCRFTHSWFWDEVGSIFAPEMAQVMACCEWHER
jgi:hypothetical protein